MTQDVFWVWIALLSQGVDKMHFWTSAPAQGRWLEGMEGMGWGGVGVREWLGPRLWLPYFQQGRGPWQKRVGRPKLIGDQKHGKSHPLSPPSTYMPPNRFWLPRRVGIGLDWIGLHWIALHCIGLDCIALDWIGLDWIGLHWIGLHCIGWDWIGLDWIALNCIGLDCIGLDCIALDWIGLHWIGLDWIGWDGIGLDCIALHCIGLDGIGLDWIGFKRDGGRREGLVLRCNRSPPCTQMVPEWHLAGQPAGIEFFQHVCGATPISIFAENKFGWIRFA